jgi:hypothetical protein
VLGFVRRRKGAPALSANGIGCGQPMNERSPSARKPDAGLRQAREGLQKQMSASCIAFRLSYFQNYHSSHILTALLPSARCLGSFNPRFAF